MPQVVEVPGMGDVEFPDDMTDEQIAAAIRKNLQPSSPPVSAPSIGGMGGFNPMARLAERAEEKAATELGMTRENVANPIANAFGPLETAVQAGSGLVGTVLGGLSGIGQGAWNLAMPKSLEGPAAADRVRQVQGAMTYQPRTGMGNFGSRLVGLPGEIYSAGTNKAGEFVTDATGSPALGAAIKTTGDIAPAVAGMRSMPKRASQPHGTRDYTPTKDAVPTTEQLTKASKEAYAVGKESGAIVPARGYNEAVGAIQKMAKEEGVDPTLHPKSSAVLKRLEETRGQDLTLQEAETLRKIALDAEDDLNPVTRQPTPDSRLAGKIVDELDERIDALSINSPARALWARSRRSQMIDVMIKRAEIRAGAHYTQAGMEHALRQEFKTLALNPRRMRGLTMEQKAAIEKVAKGGPVENALRTVGKFDPTTGGVAALASLGTSGLASTVAGPGALALPLVGMAARRLATRATSKNVDLAREALVGRGLPSAGQTSRGAPTLPNAATQGTRGPTPIRSAASIRSDIAQLQRRAGNLPRGTTPDSPQARALFQELALLSEELARAEAASAVGMRAVQ